MKNNKGRVLCISGSMRGDESNSEKMLLRLMTYIEKFGGEAELIRLSEFKIFPCEGCYSKTRDGSKCVFPCIHDGLDDSQEILEKIINANALAISSPVYWGSVSVSIHGLIEKMTAIENNQSEILKKSGREPLDGKPFVLLCSQDAEGASMALSQIAWALSQIGMMLLPWGMIFKPSVLNRKIVRLGLKIIGENKYEWIDNTIRLAARNLIMVSDKLRDFNFDDHIFKEKKC